MTQPSFYVNQQPVYEAEALKGSPVMHPQYAKPLMRLLTKMPKMKMRVKPIRKKRKLY